MRGLLSVGGNFATMKQDDWANVALGQVRRHVLLVTRSCFTLERRECKSQPAIRKLMTRVALARILDIGTYFRASRVAGLTCSL
jgi:hypothetical protein